MPTVLAEINAVLPQVISSIIIAALTWGASQIVKWFKGRSQPAPQIAQAAPPGYPDYPGHPRYPAYPGYPGHPVAPAATPTAAPTAVAVAPHPVAPTVNWSQALLHIGILQLVVNAVGALVAILVALSVSHDAFQPTFIVIQLIVGTLTAIVVFTLFGMRVARVVMWRHLTVVALGTVALTLVVNSLLEQTLSLLTPAALIIALVQTFLAMGVGGALAVALRPQPRQPLAPSAGLPADQYPGNHPYRGQPPAPTYPVGYPPQYPAGYPPSHPAGYPPQQHAPAGAAGGTHPAGPYPGGAPTPSAAPAYPAYPQYPPYPQHPPYAPGSQGPAYPPPAGAPHLSASPGAGQTPPSPPPQPPQQSQP